MSRVDASVQLVEGPSDRSHEVIAELSQEQYAAASSSALSSLVLAGAGTGKTRTLIGRLAYLYEQGYVEKSSILMLAFARKAAAEMRERIDYLLPMVSEGVQVSTFHSLGLLIVSQVRGAVPQLTELSETGALQRFIRQCFFKQCSSDPNYLSAYFKWQSFSTINKISGVLLRSLNDEYVENQAELICANLLYQLGISYLYKSHYHHPHQWYKYKSYQSGFYLPAKGIYVEVYDVAETALSQDQLNSRERYLSIHAQHNTRVLELFVESDLEAFYEHSHDLFSDLQHSTSANKIYRRFRLGRSAYHYELLVEQLGRWLPLFKHELVWPDLEQDLGSEGRLLSDLLEPIWGLYQAHLVKTGCIDFERMIILATGYVNSGEFQVPWDEIMIDEFQDISLHRAALILAMRQQRPNMRLFCVGDDWQAIYRFAGSDLRFTTEFEHFFGELQRYALSQTFRFGEILSKESSRFILENSNQSQKTLYGHEGHANPLVLCPLEQMPQRNWVLSVLETIQRDADTLVKNPQQERVSVLILSRFKHYLPTAGELRAWAQCFPNLELLQGTVHGVKGNEADYVLLLEMNRGEFGFPAEKFSDTVVERYLPVAESFPFAEERRLFYVALTRARQQVYLVYSEPIMSVFIEELKEGYSVQYLDELLQAHKLVSHPKRKPWSRLKFCKFR